MPNSPGQPQESKESHLSTTKLLTALAAKNRPGWRIITSALFEFASTFVNNGYWIGQTFDICAGYNGFAEDEFLAELSLPAFVIGGTISLFITCGPVYAHYILNMNHKNPENRVASNNQTEPRPLSFTQKAALLGDRISHIGESAGMPIMFFNLVDSNPSRWTRLATQIGATIIGIGASLGTSDTCQSNLQQYYQHNETQPQPSTNDSDPGNEYTRLEDGSSQKHHPRSPH